MGPGHLESGQLPASGDIELLLSLALSAPQVGGWDGSASSTARPQGRPRGEVRWPTLALAGRGRDKVLVACGPGRWAWRRLRCPI